MINVVGVKLGQNNRTYYFDPLNFELSKGTAVVVETARGIQYGKVVVAPKKMKPQHLVLPLKRVIRLAGSEDLAAYQKNLNDEKKAMKDARRLANELKLNMHFIDVSFTLDRGQLLFNYVAEERVDFRELAKKLAQIFRTRIELHQIGVRDKAKIVGGLGPCGLFLCCNQFLTDFDSVSINMAKNQYLSLNPTKINGVCGRLLCCLNYEDETYTQLRKGMPELGMMMPTDEGTGRVISLDLFKRTYQVDLKAKGVVEVKVDD